MLGRVKFDIYLYMHSHTAKIYSTPRVPAHIHHQFYSRVVRSDFFLPVFHTFWIPTQIRSVLLDAILLNCFDYVGVNKFQFPFPEHWFNRMHGLLCFSAGWNSNLIMFCFVARCVDCWLVGRFGNWKKWAFIFLGDVLFSSRRDKDWDVLRIMPTTSPAWIPRENFFV